MASFAINHALGGLNPWGYKLGGLLVHLVNALLVFLLRHPGEVLTRTRIYEGVWDERYDGTSNTLEVHVMELRKKLEAHGPRLIHTLRHRGYAFGDPPG